MLELITNDGRRRKISLECRAVHSKRNCPVAKRQREHIKRVHAWLLEMAARAEARQRQNGAA
jgi:hypothetical protein